MTSEKILTTSFDLQKQIRHVKQGQQGVKQSESVVDSSLLRRGHLIKYGTHDRGHEQAVKTFSDVLPWAIQEKEPESARKIGAGQDGI